MKKDCIFSSCRVKFYLKKLDKGEANVTIKHSTAQHSTAQHSTAQHSTAQHSTAQHSTAHVDLSKCVYLACPQIKFSSVFVLQRRLFLYTQNFSYFLRNTTIFLKNRGVLCA